jgi:hypothetical protein
MTGELDFFHIKKNFNLLIENMRSIPVRLAVSVNMETYFLLTARLYYTRHDQYQFTQWS